MTAKQEEKIKNKIKKIKVTLAEDKKRWGGYYHDGQGLRYFPPRLYIQLGDFSGGLRYLNWFNKNFPNDSGFPDFLFEWTIILFKTGRKKEAEKKAFQAFTRNTYLFDKFFERTIQLIDKWEGSKLESLEFAIDYFDYSHNQDYLSEFAEWLDQLSNRKDFIQLTNKFVEIQERLKNEHDREMRSYLVNWAEQLENEL
jgi:hypothetical protein